VVADEPSRAGTPSESILETLDQAALTATPMWSPDISPQPFYKVSARLNNTNGDTNGISETNL
jgi:hypothetical protein